MKHLKLFENFENNGYEEIDLKEYKELYHKIFDIDEDLFINKAENHIIEEIFKKYHIWLDKDKRYYTFRKESEKFGEIKYQLHGVIHRIGFREYIVNYMIRYMKEPLSIPVGYFAHGDKNDRYFKTTLKGLEELAKEVLI